MEQELALEADSLVKDYRMGWKRDPIRALHSVSLQVPAGVTFGLLGPNGAGKTTFVKILLGMTRATSGSARLFGKDVREIAARLPIGYLPEGGRFPTYHTADSFLRFHGKLGGLSGEDLDRRIKDVLRLVSMQKWSAVRLAKYSKGMLQRVGLAQAMLTRPRLLILDEPTDGVDPVGRAEFREILQKLNAQGVTIFLNSHILAEVELACQRVAILRGGKVLLEGDTHQLTLAHGYTVICESPKGDLPVGIEAFLDERPVPEEKFPDGKVRYRLHVRERRELNVVIDLLRRQQAEIESVERNQNTLEEVFLRVVQQ